MSLEGKTLFRSDVLFAGAEVRLGVYAPRPPSSRAHSSWEQWKPGEATADLSVNGTGCDASSKMPELTAADCRALAADLLRAADALERVNAERCSECGEYGDRCYGHEVEEDH